MADLYDRRLAEIRELRELNAELLAALRPLVEGECYITDEEFEAAKAAIAKAEANHD